MGKRLLAFGLAAGLFSSGGLWYGFTAADRVQIAPGAIALDISSRDVISMAVTLLDKKLPPIKLAFDLKVTNNNPLSVTLSRCGWRAKIGDALFAEGEQAEPVTLPAGKETVVHFTAVVQPERVGISAIKALQEGHAKPSLELDVVAGPMGIGLMRTRKLTGLSFKPKSESR